MATFPIPTMELTDNTEPQIKMQAWAHPGPAALRGPRGDQSVITQTWACVLALVSFHLRDEVELLRVGMFVFMYTFIHPLYHHSNKLETVLDNIHGEGLYSFFITDCSKVSTCHPHTGLLYTAYPPDTGQNVTPRCCRLAKPAVFRHARTQTATQTLSDGKMPGLE